MVELTLQPTPGQYSIRSVEKDGIRINDTLYRHSLLLAPDRLDSDWPARSVEDLDDAACEKLLALRPELIIIGTGDEHQMPDPRRLKCLYQAGVGVESMATAAACRTFNVVISEGRRAIALLLQDPSD